MGSSVTLNHCILPSARSVVATSPMYRLLALEGVVTDQYSRPPAPLYTDLKLIGKSGMTADQAECSPIATSWTGAYGQVDAESSNACNSVRHYLDYLQAGISTPTGGGASASQKEGPPSKERAAGEVSISTD